MSDKLKSIIANMKVILSIIVMSRKLHALNESKGGESSDHLIGCYFALIKTSGTSSLESYKGDADVLN